MRDMWTNRCFCYSESIYLKYIYIYIFLSKKIKLDPWGKMTHPELAQIDPCGMFLLVVLFLNLISIVINGVTI